MQILIISNDDLKAELCRQAAPATATWVASLSEAENHVADVVLDLLFENTAERIAALQKIAPVVIINSVPHTLAETSGQFIRVNGWPTLLKAPLVEAAAADPQKKAVAEAVFQQFEKTMCWVPDVPGFVTPRVISMIINEAYYALNEGVSTEEEIDIAMQLGTNYPYGPFAWSRLIGVEKVKALLQKLAANQSRYQPVIS